MNVYSGKSRVLSLILVIIMIMGMLPIGVLTAAAAE